MSDERKGPHPSSALRERILAKSRAIPSPTAAEVAKKRALLLVGALVPALVLLGALGVGPKGRPLALAVLVAVGWGAIASATTALVFSARSPLGPSRPMMGWLAASAPLLALSISAVGMILYPDTWSGALPPKAHAVCMVLGFAMGGAPFGAMMVHLRGLDPVRPSSRGAALGATAGTWAGTGMMLLCPHHDFVHVLVGHVLPVALFAAFGALVGSKVLALRPSALR
jgi:hypothetical protein